MIKYKVYIKAFLFILIIIGLYGFANHRNSVRKVSAIEIDFEQGDNLFITRDEVNKLLIQSLGNVKNKSKESIFLKVLEEDLNKNSMIETAEVYLTVDGILKANVLQKKPLARVVANATSYYIDSQGEKMQLSKNYSARVPIVTGIMSNNDLKQVFNFIKKVLNDDFMKNQVIGIHVKPKGRFDLKVRMGNHIVEFGTLENVNSKINKMKAIYQKMVKDKSLSKYKKINLEYNKQVVCTK